MPSYLNERTFKSDPCQVPWLFAVQHPGNPGSGITWELVKLDDSPCKRHALTCLQVQPVGTQLPRDAFACKAWAPHLASLRLGSHPQLCFASSSHRRIGREHVALECGRPSPLLFFKIWTLQITVSTAPALVCSSSSFSFLQTTWRSAGELCTAPLHSVPIGCSGN